MSRITDETTIDSFVEDFLAWVVKKTINVYNESENNSEMTLILNWYDEFIDDAFKEKLRTGIDTSTWGEEKTEDAFHFAIDTFVRETLKVYYKVNTINEVAEITSVLVGDVLKELSEADFRLHVKDIKHKDLIDGLTITIKKEE